MADYAIIGGTGVYDPALLDESQRITIDTPFGKSEATLGSYQGKEIVFMPRHGYGHSIPPHRINYRANIAALKQLGVQQVFATAAVGSLQMEYAPGALLIVDDFLDFTKSRPTTFFETDKVVHVDVTDPYCQRLRHHLRDTALAEDISIHAHGTYVCTEGPRFESPAEVKLYQQFGGAVVGMTSIPEVVLAKEAELCYATVCMVTNYGAGISKIPLTHEEVIEEMAKNVHLIRKLFFSAISRLSPERTCRCATSVDGQQELDGKNRGGEHS